MNDKQLQHFFAEHKQDVPDKGFSDKTIRRLPERQRTPGLVWIFAIISTLLVILTGHLDRLYSIAIAVIEHAAWWLLPVAGCAIALITILLTAFYERKHAIFRI